MSAHQEVTLLLPWYVNGTLNEQEMATVDAHLEHCAECRDALHTDLQEARWLHSSGNHAQSHDERVAALVARRGREFKALKHTLQPRTPASTGPRRRLRASSRLPLTMAALVTIALALPLGWLARTPEPNVYELRTTKLATESPVMQVVFKDGTSSEDIRLLIRASGTLLGEPSAYGIYRIALVTDDPAAMLSRFRTHPAVRWAEIEL